MEKEDKVQDIPEKETKEKKDIQESDENKKEDIQANNDEENGKESNEEENEQVKSEEEKADIQEGNENEKESENEPIEEKNDTSNLTEKVIEEREEATDGNRKEKSSKSKILTIIFLLLSFFILLALSTVFAIINVGNSNIYKGIKIEGVDISNTSRQDATNILKSKIENMQNKNIYLCYNDYETSITPSDIEVTFDVEDAIKNAYSIGRKNNIFINNYEILSAILFGKNVNINLDYNEEVFNNIIDNASKELPDAIIDNNYSIDGDKLIITKGKEGLAIDVNSTSKKIEQSILNLLSDDNEQRINLDVNSSLPGPIDIEKIHSEIYKEAQDAYITKNPFEIHPHVDGVDFKISMEEAKEIVSEDKDSYVIPLKITTPRITTKKLGAEAFPHTLSKFTTSFRGGTKERATNIGIAAKTINGTVLLPGETFSYNAVVGDTTPNKGYKIGTAYSGGKIVEAYGGGICQVSSTLYNAVLYANLEIVLRYNHSYPVGYVDPGRDATVSYGAKDFKFKNSRKYPIKIVANSNSGVLTIKIVGVKEEKEYDVELTSTVTQSTPYSTTYQNNASLEKGKQRIIQNGMNGYKSVAYKIIKSNGKVISKELLSSDTYKPMNRIIEVGTKETSKTQNKNTADKNAANTNSTTNNEVPTNNGIVTNNVGTNTSN